MRGWQNFSLLLAFWNRHRARLFHPALLPSRPLSENSRDSDCNAVFVRQLSAVQVLRIEARLPRATIGLVTFAYETVAGSDTAPAAAYVRRGDQKKRSVGETHQCVATAAETLNRIESSMVERTRVRTKWTPSRFQFSITFFAAHRAAMLIGVFMNASHTADQAEIHRALKLLFGPGQVIELRALDVPDRGYPKTYGGYFDDRNALVKAASELSGKGIYVSMNVVDSSLLSRCHNRIEVQSKGTKLTSDREITRRNWLLIDCDPIRRSGISSTDDERAKALQVAEAIRDEMDLIHDWTHPILADSGNGYHLLYRIDLEPEDDGVVERILKSLDATHSTPEVSVDKSVYNPARIVKLYGTLSAKGDDTPDRPHRLSRIIESRYGEFSEIPPTPKDRLLCFLDTCSCGEGDQKPSKQPSTSSVVAGQMANFIDYYNLKVAAPEAFRGGLKWRFTECPMCDHGRDAALFEFGDGALGAKCFHDSCANWGWKELRKLLEKENPDRPAFFRANAASAGTGALPSIICASDVEPEEVQWLWPGRIALGKLTLIAGDPGLGKSFLTCDIAARVSQGLSWPDKSPALPTPAEVLFLSAEDGLEDTIRPRLDASGADCARVHFLKGVSVPKVVHGVGEAEDRKIRMFGLHQDLEVLEKALEMLQNCKLVIIDPISAYMGDTDSHKNSDVRSILGPLSDLATKYGVAVVAVSHLNKNASGPPCTGRAAHSDLWLQPGRMVDCAVRFRSRRTAHAVSEEQLGAHANWTGLPHYG